MKQILTIGSRQPRFSGTAHKEFHISRAAREKYQVAESLFTSSGNVIFADYQAVRRFAQKMNEHRDLVRFPEQAVRAGDLNAMGLIDEILHYVIELYREQLVPDLRRHLLASLEKRLGAEVVETVLLRFVHDFPPVAVYRKELSAEAYLADPANRELSLEELLLLWLANRNPAFAPFRELFSDKWLKQETDYSRVISALQEITQQLPPFGPDRQPIVEMLRSPAQAEPNSLSGQLRYIMEKWGPLLGRYLYRLLGGLDLIREEEKLRFAFGPGPTRVYDFSRLEDEPERFTPDRDWMPNLVLMAKSTLVWLDQLSRKYQRPITRLDQIPDEELDQLARWGFTGLWLIGVWERSPASKKIKQLCGNPEAEASAYSLYDYTVAAELGGEAALNNLKERCWRRGIRLASDMVPNHTGIYSKWVVEHPDWFISLDYSPFPAYSFNGPNLSDDPNLGIYIEDHYYDRTDAAVVFKRVDFRTGDVRYIYHGNDGTSMPWNDTAQLNYLNPQVREAVIQTILHVARQFPIIRFDAAMTLTRRHYQRLWFPEPGSGGDIPSRAEHGMLKEQFDQLMPQEFWREVVDRVAQEAPDTLLLAEAFWLMEGYFVRTLGMHRVYNSAFMNMLKNEENQKYRDVIKKTIEFNPEILKRYVNFMNNPDEETAVAQFGKGDKYLGVCLMMVTMPGLPMFGHGQVEGFTEKYGMEYRRAYWNEQPDQDLIARHERYIFPLMKKRYLFAEVQNFTLYDLFTPHGTVNENVFAYSNRAGDERALVLYNNKFEHASGWIRTSAAFLEKAPTGESRLTQRTLAEALSLSSDPNRFIIFSDHVSGLEFIRSCRQIHEQGLFVELGAYQFHVFWNFREVEDDADNHYRQLHDFLNGRGVPSINETLRELILRPIHQSFQDMLAPERIHRLVNAADSGEQQEAIAQLTQSYSRFLQEIVRYKQLQADIEAFAEEFAAQLKRMIALPERLQKSTRRQELPADLTEMFHTLEQEPVWFYETILSWAAVQSIGLLAGDDDAALRSRSWMDEWLLGKVLAQRAREMALPEERCQQTVAVVKVLVGVQAGLREHDWNLAGQGFWKEALTDPEVQAFLQVNRYGGVLWFNREAFVILLGWLVVLGMLLEETAAKTLISAAVSCLRAAEHGAYQVEKFLTQLH